MVNKIIKYSVYALVFAVPLFFLPFTLEAFDYNKVYLLFFLVSVGLLAWLGRMIFQEKRVAFRTSLLDWFVLGFLVVAVFSSLLGADKVSSALGFYGRFWPSLLAVLSLGGFYFLVVNNVGLKAERTEKSEVGEGKAKGGNVATISGVLKVFLVSCALVAVSAYLAVFGLLARLGNLLGGKLPSVITLRTFNPTGGSLEALSLFLVCVSVLLVVLVALRDKRGLLSSGAKEKQRGWMLYALLLLNLGLLSLINFRVAWYSLIVSLVLFLLFAFWKRVFKENVNRLSLSIFLVLIALVFLLFNPLSQLLPEGSSLASLPAEVILSQRASWGLALNGLKDHWLLGSGPSSFSYIFAKYKPSGFLQSDFWQLRFDRSGSALAEFAATSGVLGILSFLAMAGMFLLVSYVIASSIKTKGMVAGIAGASGFSAVSDTAEKREERKILILPFLLTFVALLVAQFFYYQNVTLVFFFFLVMALGVVAWGARKEKVFKFGDFPEIGLVFSILFWVLLVGGIFCYFTLGKYYVADVYARKYIDNPTDNLAKLEKAVRWAPRQTTYHILLAQDYLSRFQQEVVKENPDTQVLSNTVALAVKEVKAGVSQSPNRVSVYEIAGLVYRAIQGVAQGAREWALKSFEEALKLEPKNPIVLTEIGKIYLTGQEGEKDEAKAREYFDRAIAVRPAYVDAQLQIAFLDDQAGATEQVQQRLEELVKLAPFSTEARFQLGRVYFNNKDYQKAKEQFETAVALFPNHSNSLYSLGLTYEKLGLAEGAAQALGRVLELNPGNKDVEAVLERVEAGNLQTAPSPEASQGELNLGAPEGAATSTATSTP